MNRRTQRLLAIASSLRESTVTSVCRFVRIAGLIAVVVLAGVLATPGVIIASEENQVFIDEKGERYRLTTHTGEPFHSSMIDGKVVMAVFGFTHCPDVCPMELTRVASVLEKINPQGDQVDQKVAGLFVSLDPDRDTIEKLSEYVPYFHSSIIGISGQASEIDRIANSLGIRYERVDQDDGYTIDHSTGVYMLGTDGTVQAIAPFGSSADHLLKVVNELL